MTPRAIMSFGYHIILSIKPPPVLHIGKNGIHLEERTRILMLRLGLHQDRDESEQSLRKCLPVVSFSIGDAAEFLYGEQRDVDRANKVILESGDVLIFGGKSRHVFHGVSSIKPDTAPKTLLEKTNLRSGRLNLTFREY